MEQVTIYRKFGKDVSSSDLEVINAARFSEFGSTTAIQPMPGNEDWRKIFILVKKGQTLLAFARLHEVTISLDNKEYYILGIASVVALQKGKGYGGKVISEIKDYLKSIGKTGIGFCHAKVRSFYEHGGYGVIIEGKKRFYHPVAPQYPDDDVIFIEGKDKFVQTLLANPDKKANISRSYW